MQIEITNEYSISEIKDEFNKVFPFLKLEFFIKPRCPGQVSDMKLKISSQKKIAEYRLEKNDKPFIISPKMTVADLEKTFLDEFELGIQIFRKSGGMWLETLLTEDWTLYEQNKQGELLKGSSSDSLSDPD
jgi:hypothetical protein